MFRRASLLSLTIEDCAGYITFCSNMFGSCCVPFSKKREMETRSDCARRRRVGLAADTQFVVKLRWRVLMQMARCSLRRRNGWAHVEDGAICCGGRRLSKFPYVSDGPWVTLDPIPIPYIHYQKKGSFGPYSNTVHRCTDTSRGIVSRRC